MATAKCSGCGALLTVDDRYCQQCGENNPQFNEVEVQTANASHLTSSPSSSAKPVQEGSGIGWLFLGLIIPFIGIILFFSFKKEKPNASSMSLIGAIIGFVIGFISTMS
jgi:uncharacterized membrane protein YvbJ